MNTLYSEYLGLVKYQRGDLVAIQDSMYEWNTCNKKYYLLGGSSGSGSYGRGRSRSPRRSRSRAHRDRSRSRAHRDRSRSRRRSRSRSRSRSRRRRSESYGRGRSTYSSSSKHKHKHKSKYRHGSRSPSPLDSRYKHSKHKDSRSRSPRQSDRVKYKAKYRSPSNSPLDSRHKYGSKRKSGIGSKHISPSRDKSNYKSRSESHKRGGSKYRSRSQSRKRGLSKYTSRSQSREKSKYKSSRSRSRSRTIKNHRRSSSTNKSPLRSAPSTQKSPPSPQKSPPSPHSQSGSGSLSSAKAEDLSKSALKDTRSIQKQLANKQINKTTVITAKEDHWEELSFYILDKGQYNYWENEPDADIGTIIKFTTNADIVSVAMQNVVDDPNLIVVVGGKLKLKKVLDCMSTDDIHCLLSNPIKVISGATLVARFAEGKELKNKDFKISNHYLTKQMDNFMGVEGYQFIICKKGSKKYIMYTQGEVVEATPKAANINLWTANAGAAGIYLQKLKKWMKSSTTKKKTKSPSVSAPHQSEPSSIPTIAEIKLLNTADLHGLCVSNGIKLDCKGFTGRIRKKTPFRLHAELIEKLYPDHDTNVTPKSPKKNAPIINFAAIPSPIDTDETMDKHELKEYASLDKMVGADAAEFQQWIQQIQKEEARLFCDKYGLREVRLVGSKWHNVIRLKKIIKKFVEQKRDVANVQKGTEPHLTVIEDTEKKQTSQPIQTPHTEPQHVIENIHHSGSPQQIQPEDGDNQIFKNGTKPNPKVIQHTEKKQTTEPIQPEDGGENVENGTKPNSKVIQHTEKKQTTEPIQPEHGDNQRRLAVIEEEPEIEADDELEDISSIEQMGDNESKKDTSKIETVPMDVEQNEIRGTSTRDQGVANHTDIAKVSNVPINNTDLNDVETIKVVIQNTAKEFNKARVAKIFPALVSIDGHEINLEGECQWDYFNYIVDVIEGRSVDQNIKNIEKITELALQFGLNIID